MGSKAFCCSTWVFVALMYGIVYAEIAQGMMTELTVEQRLVIAAFRLDIDVVTQLLREGANPNGRLGFYDSELFEDKRTLAWSPLASDRWTPLLAVANSHRAPQPLTHTENDSEALVVALKKLSQIDPTIIRERDERRVAIAKLLVASKGDLELDDGFGSTALASAVYSKHDSLALYLLQSGANPNVKTGVYIDGTGEITPLHYAADRPKLVEAFLKYGAHVNAKNSDGDTPLHVAARESSVESVRLLVRAGADVNAEDKEGRTALYWVGDKSDPSEMEIARFLRNAGAK
ncbi:MAG: ankyrin repeat domain-containing protein [Thermomicrobiales bacterium]